VSFRATEGRPCFSLAHAFGSYSIIGKKMWIVLNELYAAKGGTGCEEVSPTKPKLPGPLWEVPCPPPTLQRSSCAELKLLVVGNPGEPLCGGGSPDGPPEPGVLVNAEVLSSLTF
jgi:hypothetical protein